MSTRTIAADTRSPAPGSRTDICTTDSNGLLACHQPLTSSLSRRADAQRVPSSKRTESSTDQEVEIVAKKIRALKSSPLELLPQVELPTSSAVRLTGQVLKNMLIAESFISHACLKTHESLLVAADALDIRSKLMATDVPLSLIPRHPAWRYPDAARVSTSRANFPKVTNSECDAVGIVPVVYNHTPDRAESLAQIPSRHPALNHHADLGPVTARHMLSLYATVKITNIPWDASTDLMIEFLGKNTRLAPYTAVCSPVHFVLDRTSGKTQSDLFLELQTTADAERFAQRKSGKSLGTRIVNVELVSAKEMLAVFFPRRKANHWLTAEEIQNVLTHAKTFKSPYTRKCPQRPFENFMSMLILFPWANKRAFDSTQIELLYQGYVSIVSILQWHIRKAKIPQLNHALMTRLITAGTNLTDFSVEQKKIVCSLAGLVPLCPAISRNPPHKVPCRQDRVLSDQCRGELNETKSLQKSVEETAVHSAANEKLMASKSLIFDDGNAVFQNHTTAEPEDTDVDVSKARGPILAEIHNSKARSTSPAKAITKLQSSTPARTRSRVPLTGPLLREKWLENARKAGIAVGEPTTSKLPR